MLGEGAELVGRCSPVPCIGMAYEALAWDQVPQTQCGQGREGKLSSRSPLFHPLYLLCKVALRAGQLWMVSASRCPTTPQSLGSTALPGTVTSPQESPAGY